MNGHSVTGREPQLLKQKRIFGTFSALHVPGHRFSLKKLSLGMPEKRGRTHPPKDPFKHVHCRIYPEGKACCTIIRYKHFGNTEAARQFTVTTPET